MTSTSYRIRGSSESRRPAPLAGPARARPAGASKGGPRGYLHAGAEQAARWREQRHDALRVPALALHRMIEQMGGADTSYPRGSYVNLTV